MISTDLSLQLLAKEFWQQYRWLGKTIPNHQLKITIVDDWYFSRVQDFFENANWNGSHSNLSDNIVDQIDLELSLTTKDFFQCFSWQGEKRIASMNISQEIITDKKIIREEKQSILSELSQLF